MDLDAVVAALAPRLLAYGVARTGCHATAEDIAQESLMALVRHWRRMGPPHSVDAFVFAIARRRGRRAVARRALLAPLDAVRHLAGHAPSPEALHQHHADGAAVRRALGALNAKDREALTLRAVCELSVKDIATLMNTSPAAVKMRLTRARRRLAALIPELAYGRHTRTA